MTPEQDRREAIRQLLDDDPTASQRAIAEAVGCSQATVARDIAKLRGDSVIHVDSQGVSEPVSPQVSRGDALVERLRGEMAGEGLIPTSGEEELLAVARNLADRIELLQQIVAVDGERRSMKDGRVQLHPALAEIRQCEATLSRVVNGIQTMEVAPKNPVKQRAAQTRWRAHRLAEVERERRIADPHGT
jgi:DNA-binding Lrp family transcriptional regulator